MGTLQRVRLAGNAYALGGLLWLALAVTVATVYGGDPPAGSGAFLASQTGWVVVQVLLLFGFFGVLWSGGVRGVFGTLAFGLGALGHLTFLAGEVHSIIIGASSDLVPIAALVSAVGMLLTGIAVLTAKQWRGWTRWLPFVAGVYPWLCMFPFIAISGEPSLYAIGGWGLARLMLGLAIRAQTDAVGATTPAADGAVPQHSV